MPLDTYLVINHTYVDPGVILTIEPGVRVEFDDGFSLIVEGSLNATGTELNPITYTSSRIEEGPPDPFPGSWNTIAFKGNESEYFSVKHSIVEFAVDGLTIKSIGRAVIENNVIANCSGNGITLRGDSNVAILSNTIIYNVNGISTGYWKEDVSSHSGIIIRDNAVVLNHEFGLFLDSYGGYRTGDSYPYGTTAYLVDVAVLFNNISYNGKDALVIQSRGQQAQIRNVNVSNNVVTSNGGKGVSLSATYATSTYNTGSFYLHGVDVLLNSISHNRGDGIYLFSGGPYGGEISDAAILNNTVFSNAGNGIILVGSAYDRFGQAVIYDVVVTSNSVLSNSGSGIFLDYRAHLSIYTTGIIKNVTILTNKLIKNKDSGFLAESRNRSSLSYDLHLRKNAILDNYQGIHIVGAANANITENSIGYNMYGILYGTKANLAKNNDIYGNFFGMNVSYGATAIAEDNYWGHSTGPHHLLLNTAGQGNSVNGNGTDLDFMPYLTSPKGTIDERRAQSQVHPSPNTAWKTYTWNSTFYDGSNVYEASVKTSKNWQVDCEVNVTFRLTLVSKSPGLNFTEPANLTIGIKGIDFTLYSSPFTWEPGILENPEDYWEANTTFMVPAERLGRGQNDNASITFTLVYNQNDLEEEKWGTFYSTSWYDDPVFVSVVRPFLSTVELVEIAIIVTAIVAIAFIARILYKKRKAATLRRMREHIDFYDVA